ncbi:hypothetical protein ES703_48804 [subsurface metagenome]
MDVSSGGGIVKIEQTAPSSYPYTLDLDAGTLATVEAVPDFGYVFDSWSGDLSGTTNPTTLAIDCNKSITASFSQVMYTLTVDVSSSGGIVKIEQTAPPSYPYTLNFDAGTLATVEAVPDFGHVFDSWSGGLSGTTNPATLVLDCDKSITATGCWSNNKGGM